MKRMTICLGLALLALGPAGASSATNFGLAGDLDVSFGAGGVVTHDLGSGEYPVVDGMAVQPDGKIVIAGGSVPGDHGLLLARYLPDGTLDPSFGDGGYVETLTGYWAFAKAVALQPDGKIVVAGASYQGDEQVTSVFTVARYNSNGSLDASFGTGGITNTVIPEKPGTSWSEGADAIAVLPNAALVVGGESGWYGGERESATSYVLLGYKSDGSLDPSFGDRGIVRSSLRGSSWIRAQPDGKIVLAGKNAPHSMGLARYEPDGSLDATFGTSGAVGHAVTMSRNFSLGTGPLAFQHGKIVELAGVTAKGVSHAFPVLARFEAGGRLDSAFGTHGFEQLRRVRGLPTSVVAQGDGKILLATVRSGSDQPQSGTEVARLLRNGRLDPSFGKRGIVSFGEGDWPVLAAQTDGKVLIGGGFGGSWTLARLNGGENCVVPSLRGKTIRAAGADLKPSHCRTGRISKQFSSKVTRGRVISTAPLRGGRRPNGWLVDLVVSRGRRA